MINFYMNCESEEILYQTMCLTFSLYGHAIHAESQNSCDLKGLVLTGTVKQ